MRAPDFRAALHRLQGDVENCRLKLLEVKDNPASWIILRDAMEGLEEAAAKTENLLLVAQKGLE